MQAISLQHRHCLRCIVCASALYIAFPSTAFYVLMNSDLTQGDYARDCQASNVMKVAAKLQKWQPRQNSRRLSQHLKNIEDCRMQKRFGHARSHAMHLKHQEASPEMPGKTCTVACLHGIPVHHKGVQHRAHMAAKDS